MRSQANQRLNFQVMSLSEFRDLPFGSQLTLIATDGIVLLTRSVGREQRVLFSFHTYYVEAAWDQAGHLQFIRSFAHTQGLDAYLTQIDWRELA